MKSKKRTVLTGFIFVLIIAGIIALFYFGERSAPEIIFTPQPESFLPASKNFIITFKDKGQGLKEIEVFIEQNNNHYQLLHKNFPRQNHLLKHTITITIMPKKIALKDGPAFLGALAYDHSIWHWGKGNYKEVRYAVMVDTTPPIIEVLTRIHNLAKCGSELVIYRASEPLLNHGVRANGWFYPGFQRQGLYLCFFAYPYNGPENAFYRVIGEDKAGNKSEGGFYYRLLKRKFKKDKIIITDQFLRAKMPEFWHIYPELEGKYLETFIKVNTELRAKTTDEIKRICSTSYNSLLWQGPFLRMRGAETSSFGEKRTYYYKGQVIGKSIHLGVDIASITNAPIPAANNGIVIYKGYLGIYGNTIIIDHGLGLFSLYGHLSSFNVEVDKRVKKGEIIGYTGATGLAGGDHLHFGILLHGEFVNPIEWFDPKWVKSHILSKFKQAGLLH